MILRSLLFPTLIYSSMLLLVACSGTPSSDSGTLQEAELSPWELDFNMVQAKEEECAQTECAHAFIGIPVLKGGNDAARLKINTDVDALVREMIKARLPEPMSQGGYDILAQAFVRGYELFKMEFPDTSTPWYFEIAGSSSGFTADYFVLQLDVNEFMGGAHPNSYNLLQNYSLQSGALVDVRELYEESILLQMAERAFREKHKLTPDASLNDRGFLFPDGDFILPENMAVNEQGILLIYNPYEVAAYALGRTVLLLPFPENPS